MSCGAKARRTRCASGCSKWRTVRTSSPVLRLTGRTRCLSVAQKLEQALALVAQRTNQIGQLSLARGGEADGDRPPSCPIELTSHEPGVFAPEHELGDG